ncbi:MAG: hypothetical protein IJU00_15330, partial [Selenomonas sp.]|nr:hypothetical protein [Selenomonas sp.]
MCIRGGAESFESRVPGMEDGLRGFAFDLQRFADSEVVAVVVGDDKVTLTLPNLSGMNQYDTITLKDSAGTVYGTLTIPYSGDDTQAELTLNADSGVTHIDATNKNTRRSVNVLNAGKVVCTIKNGEDIGCFEIEDSSFFLGDTVPENQSCSLIKGVLTLPGYNTGDVTVAASEGLTLRGLNNGEGYEGVLTIEPLAGGRAEGKVSGMANSFLDPQNASLEASAGCFLYQGSLEIKAGADGVKAKADGDGKVALTGGAAVLSGIGEVSVDAEAGATVAWDENQQTDSTRGTYTFAVGAKASMKREGVFSYDEGKYVYTAAAVLTEGKASLTEGLCLTIGETEYKAAQAGTT